MYVASAIALDSSGLIAASTFSTAQISSAHVTGDASMIEPPATSLPVAGWRSFGLRSASIVPKLLLPLSLLATGCEPRSAHTTPKTPSVVTISSEEEIQAGPLNDDLRLDESDPENPLLIIEDWHLSRLQRIFVGRLGVKHDVAQRWLDARQIPLRELHAEAAVGEVLKLDALHALARLYLKSPAVLGNFSELYPSVVERFLILMQDIAELRKRPTIDGLYVSQGRLFGSPRFSGGWRLSPSASARIFHAQYYWYVPGDVGLTSEQLIAELNDPVAFYESLPQMKGSYELIKLPNAEPGRKYYEMTAGLAGSLELKTLLNVSEPALFLGGGVFLSDWKMEAMDAVLLQIALNDIRRIVIPIKNGGHVISDVRRSAVVPELQKEFNDTGVQLVALDYLNEAVSVSVQAAQRKAGQVPVELRFTSGSIWKTGRMNQCFPPRKCDAQIAE